MKKILFAASESVPFIKTGGLADVVGSLPKYFDKEKYDVRVMLPKYMCMKDEWKEKLQYHTHFYMDLNWRKQYVGVLEMEYDGIKFYFIDNEYYFNGYAPYGDMYADIEKFAFFSKAVLSALPLISDQTSFTAMTGRQDWFRSIWIISDMAMNFTVESRR